MNGILSCGLALVSLLTAAIRTAHANPNVNVDWDCQANPPIGSSRQLSLGSTIDGTAPSNVAPGDIFEVVLAPRPLAVPGEAAGYHLNNLRTVKLSVPVPGGTTLRSVSLSGGTNLGGDPSLSQANGVVTMSVPGPIAGGSTFQFPVLHLSLTATGSPGSNIVSTTAGTSYNNPGLEFTANLHVSPGIDPDVPTKCFPKPSPVLTTTSIDQPGVVPATKYAPALASFANRVLALVTSGDGRIFHTWWDLGGAGTGWREIPGGIRSDAAPGGSLVDKGDYAFVLIKGTNGDVVLNQGIVGSTWVGWQSIGIATSVGSVAASSNDRTITVVIATDGRVMYDWWDLGGGGHGLREVPGSFRTTTPAAAALVSKGTYAFILARDSNDNVWLNQGAPGGTWIGWQSVNIASKVAPSASSSGDRSIAVVVATDGRVMYDWWDLGGGGQGFREIPGGFRTDATVGIGLVGNGRYAFVLAKDANGEMWLNQGDPTTGVWVGWLQ